MPVQERPTRNGSVIPADDPGAQGGRYRSLFWRIFSVNAVVLALACAVAAVVFSDGVLRLGVAATELVIFAVALGAMVAVNLLVTRRLLMPIERLVELMRRFDPLQPGERVPVEDDPSEAGELATAFNEMLERLETEREGSIRRALEAQESERLRVAQEIHDEIGQSLTAALLQLGHTRKQAPPELRDEITEAVETVRKNLDELRRIAQRLRPQALEELGLGSALDYFASRLSEGSGLPVEQRLGRELPELSYEQELVVYRVAQEALTNVVRHADASRAVLELEHAEGWLTASITDDGRGIVAATNSSGGILGMRERAALIDAELSVGARPGGGTRVVLRVPVDRERAPA